MYPIINTHLGCYWRTSRKEFQQHNAKIINIAKSCKAPRQTIPATII